MRFLVLVLAVLSAWPAAYARNINGEYDNAPFHQWYAAQHNSMGQWCCDKADGHEYDGPYTMNDDGSVTLDLPNHVKFQIPAAKVLRGPNPTGHPVWWYGETPAHTYCFIGGGIS